MFTLLTPLQLRDKSQTAHLTIALTSQSTLFATDSWQGVQHQVRVLIDSGADASIMCPTLIRCLGVPLPP